ncbi:MAG TPA: ABC transporter permease [Candidatus Dormibacteraeota bacterium]|jgi:peptide/nickel transport system permease protein|nr:ABC transporter permease [Candidatus Dormibacteraeota bacterium]
MLAYLGRRLLWAVVLLWIVTVITFVLSHVVPGNPALFLAGLGAPKSRVEALTRQMGLNRPLPEQYWIYIRGLAHLDFGTSVRTGDPVGQDVAHFLPASLELGGISFLVYVILAIPLGTLAASRQGRLVDGILRIVSMAGSGVPVFWLAILFQEFFFAHLGWLPFGGRIDITASPPPHATGFYTIDSLLDGDFALFGSVVVHLILPVATIVLAMLAVGLRATRASVLDELRSPYVRTARAKGVSEPRLYTVHVLRNALNPVISIMGIQAGYLLGWIVLVETVFQWPGIGYYTFESIQALDYAPIMALTLIGSFTFIVVNLISDLLYPLLDPRMRTA